MSSKATDELRSKIKKIMLILNTLKEELANLEAKMEGLGDAQGAVKQNIEEFDPWRDLLMKEAAQAIDLEVRMG